MDVCWNVRQTMHEKEIHLLFYHQTKNENLMALFEIFCSCKKKRKEQNQHTRDTVE